MRPREQRQFPFELRAATQDGDKLNIEGYAAVFDQEVDISGWFREVIRRGAFKKTLAENDAVALYNHDTGETLGRKSAGTLALREDDHGLWMRTEMDARITGQRDTFLRIQRGDVKGMSFGFEVIKQTKTEQDSKTVLREIQEVKLYEVSPTAFPAYEMTEVQARSLLAALEATTEEAGADADDHSAATTPAAGADTTETTGEPGDEVHSTAGLWRVRILQRKLQLAEIEEVTQ